MDVVLEQRGQGILIDLNNGEERGSAANFTSREIEEEKRIVREAMADGAMGLASGLSYVPNIYMSTEELTELAKEAAAAGGIYATHARTVNGQDPAAIQEAISIGEKAGLPVHFFHLNSIASWQGDHRSPQRKPALLQILCRNRNWPRYPVSQRHPRNRREFHPAACHP